MGSRTVDGPLGFIAELPPSTFQLLNNFYSSFCNILRYTVHYKSILQIGEEKSTVIGLMRKAIAQQFTDEVSKLRQFLASFLHVHCTLYPHNWSFFWVSDVSDAKSSHLFSLLLIVVIRSSPVGSAKSYIKRFTYNVVFFGFVNSLYRSSLLLLWRDLKDISTLRLTNRLM